MTDPDAPLFVDYLFNDIDIGPEGVLFIPASDKPHLYRTSGSDQRS
ncbi:MAG: hypothetical protein R3F37_13705 [Candidatus Competibacteraceae bacterium]